MTAHVPAELRRQIAEDAGHRCGYCLSDELMTGVPLTVDHIVPTAKAGETARDNLWLACRPCNEYKGVETHASDPETGELTALFNPRRQSWGEHFTWNEDGALVVGITPTGRATVAALQLNRPLLVKARRRWVTAGWHPQPSCGNTSTRRPVAPDEVAAPRLRIRQRFVAPFMDGPHHPTPKPPDYERTKTTKPHAASAFFALCAFAPPRGFVIPTPHAQKPTIQPLPKISFAATGHSTGRPALSVLATLTAPAAPAEYPAGR